MAVINTNSMSLLAQSNLNKSQSSLQTAIERLSSGLAINSAKDNAAGAGISNDMTAQIRGLTQASKNANDGISLVQTAEGNLNTINDNLQRIRELAVQAANDTNNTVNRDSIQTEINRRVDEINRVAASANFNGQALLDGSVNATGFNIQVGAGTTTNDAISVGSSALINATTVGLGIGATATDVSTAAKATAVVQAVDTALKNINNAKANIGATLNRFQSTIDNLSNTINNLTTARSRIQDADYATEVSNMSRAQILQQAGTSVLSQANQVPQTVLKLLQ
ncbi:MULTISPECIES: flagellin N-terminal helical domain-containing protein [Dickeya]|uniref:Flagellin n=1 Tax=Dickeya aquatica TaxID=1401087 RepID=A0A375ACA5_9GAMM|nr:MULTISPECIES: flagellin [Dickeya]SLM63744.1 Flagellar biosynthesis protein FliC [Dickeya aquatica]